VKRTSAAIIFVAAVILTTDYYLFQSNLLALAWHARHGFHVQFQGFEFRVPLFFERGQEEAFDELTLYSYRSPIHGRNAWVTVGFQPARPAAVLAPLSPDDAQRLGVSLIGQRRVRLADRQGNCIEYQRDELVLRDRGPSNGDLVWITCQFDNITANFDGTRNAAPEFYTILESARRIQN